MRLEEIRIANELELAERLRLEAEEERFRVEAAEEERRRLEQEEADRVRLKEEARVAAELAE